jgi:antitoxin ParD1/3/4
LEDISTSDITISQSGAMKEWVEAQADPGRHSDAGDYLRDLLRRDQERRQKNGKMQGLVDEALESGVSERPVSKVLEDARRQAG